MIRGYDLRYGLLSRYLWMVGLGIGSVSSAPRP
jgi:hypothetical protein